MAQQPARETVAAALALLRERYLFPGRAGQAAAAIEARLAGGEYDDLDETALAERLTSQLYGLCADRHLRVEAVVPGRPEPGQEQGQAGSERGRLDNFGIRRAERLDGNIGYLDLRRIPFPGAAAPAIAAAMQLVCGTYALIIDLRRNSGGAVEGVTFWCSYFFPDPSVHLNDVYDGTTGLTRQYWSLPYLPGERYTGRPVYVLTSGRTFSGGEEFCYNLQVQGRATLIGETTRGGAHQADELPVSATMVIKVPYARSINPVTGTNWEGTGVTPDIAVPAGEAQDVAYAAALRHVLALPPPGPVEKEARAALGKLEGPDQADP
ncbi:MAG TPA: S41 family peptidase [Streptosporangiaceae bacterium]|nr:S41 family peptidase [Streptosporangiaceae bacterium]